MQAWTPKPDLNRLLKNDIMVSMSAIEKHVGKLFHEYDPELEREIWQAIDANDTGMLREIRDILEDILTH